MTIPQQSLPNVPLVAQPVFLVDLNGNPIVPAQDSGDLSTIATNTTGLATQATLAAAKTDLDTIATNTTTLAARGPSHTATQAANTAGNVAVKGTPGTLWSATVTTLGTAALSIYDNASTNSGTILLTIPASAPVGTIYQWTNGQPAANGITSNGVLNCPAVTFSYS